MTALEILHPWKQEQYEIHTALFDWDGTVSLIRTGWQDVMIPYFIEVVEEADPRGDPAEIRSVVTDFVDTLTGKQTIFQCIRLNEEVVKRGGPERDPLLYKKEYLRRLEEKIHDRKEALRNGTADPEEYTLPGARRFLELLQSHGISCTLASGTDEPDVLYEASLLRLDKAFEGGIHGARDEVRISSKALAIQDMLETRHVKPRELVSFGDGFVEVQMVAELGGLAIGVASDEVHKHSQINAWKRRRLSDAGAFAIIPDFVQGEEILQKIQKGV